MKVGLAYSFFDNINEIPYSLGLPNDKNAVCNNVNYIIAINGRYQGYETDHDYSIDGSEEFIKDNYKNAIIERFSGYQLDKRQRGFDIAGELGCDWLIVLDTDEFLQANADWPLFYSNLNRTADKNPNCIFGFRLFISRQYRKAHNKFRWNQYRHAHRVYRNPGELRYVIYHYMVTHKDVTDEQIVKGESPILKRYHFSIPGIEFLTHSKFRDMRFLKNRDGWAWWTICVERGIEYNAKAHYLYNMNHYSDEAIKSWKYDKQGNAINKNILTDKVIYVRK
jgi:hypothetical protein